MTPTRVLHLSDTHLGNRMYQSDVRKQDFMDAFRAGVELAIEENVDAVLHTGDLFDDPNPNLQTVIECSEIIERLGEENIPFLVIVGNHERKREQQWVDLMKKTTNSIERLSKEPVEIGGFSIYGIDSIRKNEWSTTEFDLEPPEDDSSTTILAMHELVQPIVPEIKGADYHIEEIIERLSLTPKGIAIGDYHSHQEHWEQGCRVFYPGPTERTKYSENPGTVLILETSEESKDLTIEKRNISEVNPNVPREFAVREIKIGETQGIEVVKEQIENLKRKYDITEVAVIIKLSGSKNGEVAASDVYELLDENGVKISRVLDKRDSELFDIDIDIGSLQQDILSIEDTLDKELSNAEISPQIEQLVERVSDEEFAKSKIRDETRAVISNTGDTQ